MLPSWTGGFRVPVVAYGLTGMGRASNRKRARRESRPRGSLEQALREQYGFLVASCASFDAGNEAEAKRLASTMRTLLNHAGSSFSVLEQLGLRERLDYYDTAHFDPENLLPQAPAIHELTSGSGGRWVPRCKFAEVDEPRVPFKEWWNAPVLRDATGSTWSRQRLIRTVANTDGGAHVDPTLETDYAALSARNSMGFVFVQGSQPGQAYDNGPELAAIRQFAYELERTLREQVPGLV